jgi:hypothetical protein
MRLEVIPLFRKAIIRRMRESDEYLPGARGTLRRNFVSGHDHAFPYLSSQSWNQRLGEIGLLVPGRLLRAPVPNYINLDTESGEILWHATSESWIPEDGLFDHLVLKFVKD